MVLDKKTIVLKRRAYDLKYKKPKLNRKINDSKTRKKYPERYKAGNTLRNAVNQGRMNRLPCEVCGNKKSEGHHEDYTKPLQVKWLCHKHHLMIHNRYINL